MSTSTERLPRILVVDDDRAVRESLRRSLEFNGFEVGLASDGAEALATITGNPPDALVIDVMMPRLDGLETTRALRAAGNDMPRVVKITPGKHLVADFQHKLITSRSLHSK